MVQAVSLTYRLIGLFRQSQSNGPKDQTSSTPNRFSLWRVAQRQDGKYPVVSGSHKIIGFFYEQDDAESVVHEHNKLVHGREEWYGH